jgi:hypothetical protein
MAMATGHRRVWRRLEGSEPAVAVTGAAGVHSGARVRRAASQPRTLRHLQASVTPSEVEYQRPGCAAMVDQHADHSVGPRPASIVPAALLAFALSSPPLDLA